MCEVACGQVVNPAGVEQQIKSGIVFGLSAALAYERSGYFLGGACGGVSGFASSPNVMFVWLLNCL